MRGIFWNSRGLKDLAKRRFLADASVEHRLDFIALSETGRANFSPHFLNTLSGGIEFDSHCLPPRGRSGGILLGVRYLISLGVILTLLGGVTRRTMIILMGDGCLCSTLSLKAGSERD